MIAGKEPADLSSNRMLELALTRLFKIVGESAGRVSQDVRKQFPEIPWKGGIGMRNCLILDHVWVVHPGPHHDPVESTNTVIPLSEIPSIAEIRMPQG